MDVFMFIDMILTCFTGYHEDGVLKMEWKSILLHYLTTGFIFDFLGIVPGLVTVELFKQIYFLKLLRYM